MNNPQPFSADFLFSVPKLPSSKVTLSFLDANPPRWLPTTRAFLGKTLTANTEVEVDGVRFWVISISETLYSTDPFERSVLKQSSEVNVSFQTQLTLCKDMYFDLDLKKNAAIFR